jgi:hypothetical protein
MGAYALGVEAAEQSVELQMVGQSRRRFALKANARETLG